MKPYQAFIAAVFCAAAGLACAKLAPSMPVFRSAVATSAWVFGFSAVAFLAAIVYPPLRA